MNIEFLKKAEEAKPKLTSKTHTVKGGQILAENECAVYDFGTHVVGYPKLYFSAVGAHYDAPALVKVRFCETAQELDEDTSKYNGWISKGWLQDDIIHLDELPCAYAFRRRFAFRYIKVEVIATSPKYKLCIEKAVAKCVTSAPEQIAICGSDRKEKAIDKIALKTLSECMQYEFEDGPKRDMRLWLGDLRLQALTNYQTYRHNDLVKRCLYLFAATADDEGNISQCVFTKPEVAPDDTSMFDYSLLFIPTLYDYFMATGDKQTINDLLPLAEKQIEIAKKQFNGNAIEDCDRLGWCFLDWSLELNKQAGAQAVYIYAEKSLVKLLKELQKDTSVYEQDIALKSVKAIEKFYDKAQGLFVSGEQRQISYATNVWYVLAEVFGQKENAFILEHLKTCENVVKPVTPYMMHHYVQALINSGNACEGRKVMCDYWGGMAEHGADTFWELYNPENPDESPYGGKAVNSYCHAWSCTPSYFLRKYFAEV